jgi:CheY-like chemotaxis protein
MGVNYGGSYMRAEILIVDDDEDFQAILVHTLTRAGFQTVTAANGEIALDYLMSGKQPSGIICDLEMPRPRLREPGTHPAPVR